MGGSLGGSAIRGCLRLLESGLRQYYRWPVGARSVG